METSIRCSACVAILVAAFEGGVAAQGDASFTSGSGVYASDEFCEDTNAFFSVFELSGGGDLFGGSVAYSNGSHPWPGPPPGGERSGPDGNAGSINLNRGLRASSASPTAEHEAFLTHGRAIRLMAETFPVAVLSRLLGERARVLEDINRYVRPSFGMGLYVSGDGRTAPAGDARDLPTYGLEGSASPMLSYGARAYLPGRDKRIRFTVHYRANTMFVREVAFNTPDGETLRRDGETMTWGEWGVGISFRIGPSRGAQPTTLTAR